jgi:hypothetical protein
MRDFSRAVELLQKLDNNRMGDNPIDRVTQDLVSDLRRFWSARDLAEGNQRSKGLPELLHNKGCKKERRRGGQHSLINRPLTNN